MPAAVALIVEDQKDIRDIAKDILEGAGYHVFAAETGEDGLTLLEAMQVDLILVDIVTRGEIGGCELVRKAKERNRDVKVICSTGYHGLVNHCETRKCDVLLPKQSRRNQLAAMLSELEGAITSHTRMI